MSNTIRPVILALVALAIATAIGATYMYDFREKLIAVIGVIDTSAVDKAGPLFAQLITVWFGQSFIAFIAIIFMVVYIMRYTRDAEQRYYQLYMNGGLGDEEELDNAQEATQVRNKEEEQAHIAELLSGLDQVKEIDKALHIMAQRADAVQAAFYLKTPLGQAPILKRIGKFALFLSEDDFGFFEYGSGLIGQVGSTGREIMITNLPDKYLTVVSGLGESYPRYLVLVPYLNESGEVEAVGEYAFFTEPTATVRGYLRQATATLAAVQLSMTSSEQ